jgi:hypothetical protein
MVVAVAEATVVARTEFPRLRDGALPRRMLAQPSNVQKSQTALAAEWPFALTDQSEILLNGKPCRFEEVPAQASISLLELAADRHTVLRIHFRTQR